MSAPELHWLPKPQPDWRRRIAALADGDGKAARAQAVALAGYRLGFPATNAIDQVSRHLSSPTVRLAVLASSTTAHLAGGLRVGALRRGLDVEIYEPDFGQYRQDLADPGSRFHRFAPTHVLFAFDADMVAAHGAGTLTRRDAKSAADALLEDWTRLWSAARQSGASVLQQTVLPRHAASGGSNDHRVPGSAAAFVALVNDRLRDAADAEAVDLVSVDTRVAIDGLDAWHSPTAWCSAKQEIALPAAPVYGDLVARVIAARLGRGAKCCVFDLDNTLWGGVVGDDGVGGLVLGQGSAAGEAFLSLHRYALELKRRGILLAVNSKNDEAVARRAFDEHPDTLLKSADFSCFVANWGDKATNLRAIAKALNIGLDALVFVDDNPFEREQVRGAVPEVFVPELPDDPALVPRCLADSGCFELVSLTSEDLGRAELYAAEAQREAVREQAGDLQSYLASLGMVLDHALVREADLVRVAQLVNKTNQFNLATRRLSEDEVRAIAADPDRLALRLRLTDRFGDAGIIGVVTGHGIAAGRFVVDDWLMSCRVIGRDVEYATLLALIERLKMKAVSKLEARFTPSGRNAMVGDLLGRLGFDTRTDADGVVTGTLDLATFAARPSPVVTKGEA